jgi:hypothetical protein
VTGRRDGLVSAVTTASFAALLLTAACGGDGGAGATPEWVDAPGHRWHALTVPRGTAGFTSLDGARTGIRFTNEASDSILLGNRVLGQGAGIALGDVDGDGLVDLFLARTEGCNALYRNRGGWRFDDATDAAGVGACDRRSSGAAFADVDGDGDLDLVLLATTGPNAIFLNDGQGRFTERRDLGLDTTGTGGTTIAMADVDGSGRLALFVANYKPYFTDDTVPPQRRAFNQMVRLVGPGRYEVLPEHQRDYKLVMRPDMGGMRLTQRAAADAFHLNDGSGRFTRVPFTSERFVGTDGRPLTEAPESFALGATLVDLTGDGAPELYIANDFEDPDQLWINDGTGRFRLADWRALRQMSNSAMGVDVADIDGDGRFDLFVTDMLANDGRRDKTQIPTHTAFPKKPGEMQLQLQQQRNTLFLNRGDGTFAEIAQAAGVSASGWSWGTLFLDVDLDGWPDLLVANGHLYDIMDADIQERLQNRLTDIPWQRLRWEFPPLRLKNVAFRNRGDRTFEDASAAWRFGLEEDVSHAIASADLDGDGDEDVVVNRLGAPALVLRNDAPAPRVSVRLVGDAPNTRAVGARVRLLGGAVPEQVREVLVGGRYLSHSDYALTFAMGASDSATLVVEWRDGRRTTIDGVRANRHYEVNMSTAVAPTPTVARPAAPLFTDATAELGGHRHVEDVFDDWDRQFLLPDALSQSGPGVAWFDLDGDGREELLVGTGTGGRIGVFRNVSGRMVPQPASGPVAPVDLTTVLGMREGGAVRLLAGAASWQLRDDAVRMAQPGALAIGVRGTTLSPSAVEAVGSHAASTGPLALGDVDGDGRLDLFVGSRAAPMRYPEPVSSGLFRNVGGTFVLDTANTALLRRLGLVTAATFADINGDGHADLVVAREWGSLVLLLNDGRGRLVQGTDAWGLAPYTSRWNGIATGDLDGDGRLDLVATSWGRNTFTPADSANPLVMVYGPFGTRGEVEMLLARQDPRVGGLAPYTSYARARMAVANLVGRVNSFAAYADASVDRVLGSYAGTAERLEARSLDHVLFLNRGDRFQRVPLPAEAQWAPAFAAAVADADGDGAEDLFLGQNFSPTVVGTPRYDAGRSLLLRGNGSGGLEPMSGTASGLVVYGDQRGAAFADADGDGRLDLAVSQNGAETRFFRNTGGKPGLRVRLDGGPMNPGGVGAQVRVVYGERMGPVREVQAGTGYWSQHGAVQVMGLDGEPTAVWVRWPGGETVRVAVGGGVREVVVVRGNR